MLYVWRVRGNLQTTGLPYAIDNQRQLANDAVCG